MATLFTGPAQFEQQMIGLRREHLSSSCTLERQEVDRYILQQRANYLPLIELNVWGVCITGMQRKTPGAYALKLTG